MPSEQYSFIDLDCVLHGNKVSVMFKTGLDIEDWKLFNSAAQSEPPGRHAACRITARVSRTAPAEQYRARCAPHLGNNGS